MDDGSTDGTAEVARQAGARLIQHQRNLGLSAARNAGIDAASHQWVALLDSDDLWLPHHLATLWQHRDAHVLLASAALRCRGNAEFGRFQGPVAHRVEVHDAPNALIYPGNFVCVSAAMVQRSAVRAAGGFRSHYGLVEDLDLWIRLLEAGTAAFIPLVTINYRLHEGQMSARDARAMQRAHIAAALFYEGHAWSVRSDIERWKATADWDNAKIALRDRRYRNAASVVASILTHGHRTTGLIGMLLWRFLIRRRGSEVDRDGWPSISVLPNDWSEPALASISADRRLRVRHHETAIDGVRSLIRRPSGVAFVGSPRQAALVRLLRIRSCGSSDEAHQMFPRLSSGGQASPDRQPLEPPLGGSEPVSSNV